MTLRSMFRGPVSKLALVGAALLMLSGVPAYADSGGYHGQGPYDYGTRYGSGSCQQPGGWNGWNAGNRCQNNGQYRGPQYYQNDRRYGAPQYDNRRYVGPQYYQNDRRYGAPQYDNRRYVGPQYPQYNDCRDPNRGGCQAPQPNDQRNIHDDGNSK